MGPPLRVHVDEGVALPHMMAALGEMVMMTEIAEQQNDQLSWRIVLLRVINIVVMALGLAAVLWGAGTAALSTPTCRGSMKPSWAMA